MRIFLTHVAPKHENFRLVRFTEACNFCYNLMCSKMFDKIIFYVCMSAKILNI